VVAVAVAVTVTVLASLGEEEIEIFIQLSGEEIGSCWKIFG
jgi:hypothetical protein